jgi:hypothetical protein
MFAPGVSGNPAGKRRLKDRADALYQIMAADIRPSTATDELLLHHACTLLARAERVHSRKDIDIACRMSGEARRLIVSLRRRAAPTGPPETLKDYLVANYTAEKTATSEAAPDAEGPSNDEVSR